MTIIPAPPGWQLALFAPADKNGEAEFVYTPIIAWAINEGGANGFTVKPITLESSGELNMLRTPEGLFVCATEDTAEVYDNETEALERAQREHDSDVKP